MNFTKLSALLLMLLLFGTSAHSQQQNVTANNLRAMQSFNLPRYSSTAVADAGGAGKPNSMIITYGDGDQLWMRNAANTGWTLLSSAPPQVQTDWAQENTAAPDYFKNRPGLSDILWVNNIGHSDIVTLRNLGFIGISSEATLARAQIGIGGDGGYMRLINNAGNQGYIRGDFLTAYYNYQLPNVLGPTNPYFAFRVGGFWADDQGNVPFSITMNGSPITVNAVTGDYDLGTIGSNFANADLTFDGPHTHDIMGNVLEIKDGEEGATDYTSIRLAPNSVVLTAKDATGDVAGRLSIDKTNVGLQSNNNLTVSAPNAVFGAQASTQISSIHADPDSMTIKTEVAIGGDYTYMSIKKDAIYMEAFTGGVVVPVNLNIQALPLATASDVLYYNATTGAVTYGAAPSGGGGSTKFGKSGEDATAAENRSFNLGSSYDFNMTGSPSSNLATFTRTAGAGTEYALSTYSNDGTATWNWINGVSIGRKADAGLSATVQAGFGVTLDYKLAYGNTASQTEQISNRITSNWLTQSAGANYISQLEIQGLPASGGLQNIMTLAGTGRLILSKYGVGSFASGYVGTPSYLPALTSAGQLIEMDKPVMYRCPTYADDAAAAADSGLPTNGIYKVTGSNVLHIK